MLNSLVDYDHMNIELANHLISSLCEKTNTCILTFVRIIPRKRKKSPTYLVIAHRSKPHVIYLTEKDAEMTELRNNLTYYMNAFSSSQQLLENVRALEAFLQTQVSLSRTTEQDTWSVIKNTL